MHMEHFTNGGSSMNWIDSGVSMKNTHTTCMNLVENRSKFTCYTITIDINDTISNPKVLNRWNTDVRTCATGCKR